MKKAVNKLDWKHSSLRKVLIDQDQHTKELEKKYPWYPTVMRWITVAAIMILAIVVFDWRMDVRMERRADERAAVALAEYQAEQLAIEEEKQAELLAQQQSEEAKKLNDTILMAKLLSGINAFVEKYNYSDGDLRTYGECVINRVLNNKNGFPGTIEEVILQNSQWVGFSESNQLVNRYYKIAAEIVEDYYSGKTRPCTSDFCWAELNRNGIWLKNEFSDSKYVRTWRYSE